MWICLMVLLVNLFIFFIWYVWKWNWVRLLILVILLVFYFSIWLGLISILQGLKLVCCLVCCVFGRFFGCCGILIRVNFRLYFNLLWNQFWVNICRLCFFVFMLVSRLVIFCGMLLLIMIGFVNICFIMVLIVFLNVGCSVVSFSCVLQFFFVLSCCLGRYVFFVLCMVEVLFLM